MTVLCIMGRQESKQLPVLHISSVSYNASASRVSCTAQKREASMQTYSKECQNVGTSSHSHAEDFLQSAYCRFRIT